MSADARTRNRAQVLGRLRTPALGAVVAQVWQAVGTFLIQVLAARLLGAEGLGSMALCLGVIIMATAFTSGMVGDSLTVLDRQDRRVRAGLQVWAAGLAMAGSALCAGVLLGTGVLDAAGAAAFFAATTFFQVEELLRRVLMVSMRFWSLVLVDSSALATTVGLLVLLGRSGASLLTFMLAITGGQLVGCVVAALLAPRHERRLVPMRDAAVRDVASFGLWRGAQVTVTPTAITLSRLTVIAIAGVVALGELEAARILVAPVMLVIQGLGSYLLASYARDRSAPLSVLIRRASRASLGLALGALGVGAVAALLAPVVAHLVTGPSVRISSLAVFGWAVYSASVATVQPFASLAAARGRQRDVLFVRLADCAVGLSCLGLLLGVLNLSASWTPYALAVGLLFSGVVMRNVLLRPMSRREQAEADAPSSARSVSDLRPASGTRLARKVRAVAPRGRVVAILATTALGASALTALPATADPVPTPLPTTVAANALPTWQINGVGWSQAIVGNTVYVAGSFTKARPPGVPVGGAGEVPAGNIFAYDLVTGNRVASFDHTLNAQGLALQASPDGSRLYVGGDFTTVDGQSRPHVASFNTADGTLTDWNPNVDGQVRALAVTSSTVYAGGNFRSANGQPRMSLASFGATSRTLSSWAPTAEGDGGYVWAMTLSPDGSRVIAGGSFSTLSLQPAYGMGALDAVTGAVLPWAANERIRTAGLNGGITSLKTDGVQIYGSGYAFGAGASFEGTFAADPGTGAINWVNDCLGDTYDVFPKDSALYWVSHAHNCSVVGGFPDTNPRARWIKAAASPTFPTGMTTVKDAYGWDFRGLPYAGLLQFYPDLEFGTYTAERQAAWSVTGSGSYVTMAGEFPIVNGTAQQGLVRFANRGVAAASQKPLYSAAMTPVASSPESGVVRLAWTTTWDRDDKDLSYDVYRDDSPSIGTVRSPSTFWDLRTLTFVDKGRTPGATHVYKVRAKDSDGNVQWSTASAAVTVSDVPPSPYTQAVRADGALHHWKLGDVGPTFFDSSGTSDGTAASATFGASGALAGDPAVSSAGGSTPKLSTTTSETQPTTVTVEAWVRTTSTQGGRIVGFGDSSTGTSAATTNDQVLYLNANGKAAFAVNSGSWRSLASTASVNDGQWHHLAASAGGDGLSLYVDGRRVGRDQTPVTTTGFPGYWRLLADQTSGLPSTPKAQAISGSIDEVAVYPSVLTLKQVQKHYLSSGRTPTWGPTPTDAYALSVVSRSPDLFWRLGEATGGTTGDASSSGNPATVTGVTWGRPGALTGTGDTAAAFNGISGLAVAKESWTSPTTYSAELWFSSTSKTGGKLIGFGNAASGLSTSYDRQVVLLSNGRLQFGTNPGVRATAETSTAYNDGQWHHVVATQGPDGMKLYVDSVLVATNPATTAQGYVGYWRLGGDRTFGGTLSNYVSATIDEAAVYPTVLSQAAVEAHYAASGRQVPNKPPVASFSATKSYLQVAVDASASSDPDGTISSYGWTFGDGGSATGASASHTYSTAGTFTVTLTVTDNSGARHSQAQTVSVAPNGLPVASFTSSHTELAASFDATASSDPEGPIASYAWTFGDGSSGTGATATHSYADDGTYDVTLVVTDGSGATATVMHPVTVAGPANVLPTAAFTHAETFLATALDATTSSDPDGSVTAYAWTFGDGATGSGATPSHTYAASGTYTVTLTVTDNRGGTRSTSQPVTVASNVPPTAAFTQEATFLSVAVDGTSSTDPDGTIAGYAWDFGDATTGSGATANHTYAVAGTYAVTLTVTDGLGATGQATTQVTVASNPVLVTDEFTRSASSGWGSAELGGAWSVTGTASRYSVADGVGKVALGAGSTGTTSLAGVTSTNAESSVIVSTDKAPTGGGFYASLVGRRVSATSDYRAKLRLGSDGAVTVWIVRTVNGAETLLTTTTVPNLTYSVGDRLRIRQQVTGTAPTTLKVKVWKNGTSEPAAWSASTTDATSELQSAGGFGTYAYVSGSATNAPVTFAFDSLWAGAPKP